MRPTVTRSTTRIWLYLPKNLKRRLTRAYAIHDLGMSELTEMIRALEPTLVPVVDGSWLAVAGPRAAVQIGVLEPTPELARLRFAEARQRVISALENC